MEIFVKRYPDCIREAFVKVTGLEVNDEFDRALQSIGQNITVSGYRRGRVPPEIIEKRNIQQVKQQVLTNLISKTISKLKAEGTRFYTEPNFNPLSELSRSKEFSFKLIFEIKPQVKQDVDFTKFTIDYEQFVVDDQMVNYTMQRNLELLNEVSGKIKIGDIVTVNLLNKNYLGDNREFIFESKLIPALIEHKKGDKLKLTFDDLGNYVVDFLGKISEPVEIEIIKVERLSNKPLDDETIQHATPYKTLDEYKKVIRENLEKLAESLNWEKKQEALSRYVAKNIPIEIPKSFFILSAQHDLVSFIESTFHVQNLSIENLLNDKGVLEDYHQVLENSYYEVYLWVFIENISKKHYIEPDPDRIKMVTEKFAQEIGMNIEEFHKKATAEDKKKMEFKARQEATLEFVLQQIKFNPKKKIPLIDISKVS